MPAIKNATAPVLELSEQTVQETAALISPTGIRQTIWDEAASAILFEQTPEQFFDWDSRLLCHWRHSQKKPSENFNFNYRPKPGVNNCCVLSVSLEKGDIRN